MGRGRNRGRGGHAGAGGFDADSAGGGSAGFTGELREGSTATDLVLTVTEALRKKGVVGKFVEYFRSRPGER